MGASYITMTHDGSEKSMREAYNQQVEQDGYDCGHSYSGSFSEFSGLRLTGKMFGTDKEANTWLMDNTNKWEEAKAVQVKFAKLTPAQATRISVLEAKAQEASTVMYAKRRAYRDQSQIGYGRTKIPAYVVRAEKAMIKADLAVDKIWEQVNDVRAKAASKSNKSVWLIGGWASC